MKAVGGREGGWWWWWWWVRRWCEGSEAGVRKEGEWGVGRTLLSRRRAWVREAHSSGDMIGGRGVGRGRGWVGTGWELGWGGVGVVLARVGGMAEGGGWLLGCGEGGRGGVGGR